LQFKRRKQLAPDASEHIAEGEATAAEVGAALEDARLSASRGLVEEEASEQTAYLSDTEQVRADLVFGAWCVLPGAWCLLLMRILLPTHYSH
jgi:hypothetical protein